jgi:hypothetical protein
LRNKEESDEALYTNYVCRFDSYSFLKGPGGSGVLNNIVDVAVCSGMFLDQGYWAVEPSSYAVDLDGFVWAWGYNYFGQLGNGDSGSNAQETTPVQVKKDADTPLTDIVYIDAGYEHSLAIDKYGNIWVWGYNIDGRLGLGHNGTKVYATPMPQNWP